MRGPLKSWFITGSLISSRKVETWCQHMAKKIKIILLDKSDYCLLAIWLAGDVVKRHISVKTLEYRCALKRHNYECLISHMFNTILLRTWCWRDWGNKVLLQYPVDNAMSSVHYCHHAYDSYSMRHFSTLIKIFKFWAWRSSVVWIFWVGLPWLSYLYQVHLHVSIKCIIPTILECIYI